MDEPTNDLDVETLELLEEELANYGGTLLLVSHDRDFIDHVATSVLVIEEGRVTAFPGGYSDWQAVKERQQAATAPTPSTKAQSVEAPTTPKRNNAATRLSYKEQQLLKTLPEKIEALEARVAELNTALTQPDADYAALSTALAEAEAELETSLELYFEVEAKAEALK
jgi:ATP-binding cassette subfamily F protein uup